jgi:hypothetical protein
MIFPDDRWKCHTIFIGDIAYGPVLLGLDHLLMWLKVGPTKGRIGNEVNSSQSVLTFSDGQTVQRTCQLLQLYCQKELEQSANSVRQNGFSKHHILLETEWLQQPPNSVRQNSYSNSQVLSDRIASANTIFC